MVESDKELKRMIEADYLRTFDEHFERLKYMAALLPDEFSTPELAYHYFEEASLCYYHGAFVATIVLVQMTFEELLRSLFHTIGKDFTIEREVNGKWQTEVISIDDSRVNFFYLIKKAFQDGLISQDQANELHHLRKEVRNLYVHPKYDKPNVKTPTLPDALTYSWKITGLDLVDYTTEQEARDAITLLLEGFPWISTRFWGDIR